MQFDCAVMSSAIMTLEDAATRAVENPDKPITPLTRAMAMAIPFLTKRFLSNA